MRAKPIQNFTSNHQCGGYGYAVGSKGKKSRIKFDSGKWNCPKCLHFLIDKWMDRVDYHLHGSVLYSVQTMHEGIKLSSWIRRNIKKGTNYYCVHLEKKAIVFSNSKFKDAIPRNRKKFLKEIRELMESGEVTNMSRRPSKEKKAPAPKNTPWSFAIISEEIIPEYSKCKSDYEIGLLLSENLETSNIRCLHKSGKELLQKIKTGEINASTQNLADLNNRELPLVLASRHGNETMDCKGIAENL